MQSPGLTAPFWGMRGSEDLGGGYHAVFQLESFFQPANGGIGRTAADPFWGRNAFVGIDGDFGRVTLGRHTNLLYLGEQAVNPFVASVLFSPLVVQTFVASYGGSIIGDTVWNNNIQYTSPNLHGLTVTGAYSVGGVAGQGGIANVALSANYVAGPLKVVMVAQRDRTAAVAPSTGQNAYLAGLVYTLPVVELSAALQTTNSQGIDAHSQTWALGAAVPVSLAGKVLLAWSYTRRASSGTANVARNTGSAGYDYALSKRTDLYAVTVYDKLANGPVGMTWAVGVRHTF